MNRGRTYSDYKKGLHKWQHEGAEPPAALLELAGEIGIAHMTVRYAVAMTEALLMAAENGGVLPRGIGTARAYGVAVSWLLKAGYLKSRKKGLAREIVLTRGGKKTLNPTATPPLTPPRNIREGNE